MPTLITKPPLVTQVTCYKCDYCAQDFHYSATCKEHEWEVHARPKVSRHQEYIWDEEFDFLNFPDEETFQRFIASHCARPPEWEGVGWYKETTYRDTLRGCDMGETITLTKVDPTWPSPAAYERTRDLDILFGDVTLDEDDGWEWRTVELTEKSILIRYAAPMEYPRDLVVDAWKIWSYET